MYIRLNRTHGAFWTGGKGLFLNQTSLLLFHLLLSVSVSFFYFCVPIFSFFLFPFLSLALLRRNTAPLYLQAQNALELGWQVLRQNSPAGTQRQLARVTQCCSWTQQQPNSLKTNSAESSVRQRQGWWSAEFCSIGWLWRELEEIFFPFFSLKYIGLARCQNLCQNP